MKLQASAILLLASEKLSNNEAKARLLPNIGDEDMEHYHSSFDTNIQQKVETVTSNVLSSLNDISNSMNSLGSLNTGLSDSELNFKIEKNLKKMSINMNRLLKRKKRMAMRRKFKIQSRKRRQIIELTDEEHTAIENLKEVRTQHWESNFSGLDFLFEIEDITNDPESLKKILELAKSEKASSTLGKSKSPLLQALNPYGCWCNFDLIPGMYVGEPQNEFDSACKTLQEGYRCIGIDEGQECSDNAEKYMTTPKYMRMHSKDQLIDGLHNYCDRMNKDNTCGYNLCMVEAYFINTIFNLLQTGHRIDLTKSHKMGFDPDQHCELRQSLQTPSNWQYDDYQSGDYYYYEYPDTNNDSTTVISKEKEFEDNLASLSGIDQDLEKQKKPIKVKIVPDQCCGNYPERAPYNPGSSGTKDCCQVDKVSSIFNTITHMCCPDGSSMKLGEC